MNQPEKRTKKLDKKTAAYLWGVGAVAAAVLILALAILFAPTGPEAEVQKIIETLPAPEANPYRPEDFAYEGDYLTSLVSHSALGVDVSEHQGEIDWQQVREAGVEFAMIRLGYRGYTEGGLFADAFAMQNLEGAREAGLKVGAYFYSQAVNPAEAREEARFASEILGDFSLDYPLVYDWEYVSAEARTGLADAGTVTDNTIAFCQEARRLGYEPMVYFNQDLAQRLFILGALTDYEFWLAMYTDQMTYPYRVDMWQYTAEGAVPGIAGTVDLNLMLP